MASPFRIFRKYQKMLLVVAGVVLMFVFVIGDSLVAYLGGSPRSDQTGRDANTVAVTWDTGSLTNREVDQLVSQQHLVSAFLRGIHDAGVRSALLAGVEPSQLRVQPLQSLVSQPREEGVVATKLFAEAAYDAGIRVSDEAIIKYLDELGRQRVSRDDMREMLKQAGGGRVPIQYVMDALREELLAHSYLASFQFAFRTVTPEQGYQDWLRVNDRIVVEAAAVPVDSFVVEVPDPTEADLKDLFEEHKMREPQPDLIGQVEFPSPVPGFRIPRKIDVQFIQAEYDQFLAKVENEITEEEIAKFYDDNKDPLFIKAETGLFDDDAATADQAGEARGDAGTNTEQTESTDTPETSPPATESGPPAENGQTQSATTPSSSPAAGGETPAEGSPSENNQSSRRNDPRQRSVFRLTALAQEQSSQAEDASTEPATEAVDSSPATQPDNSATGAGPESGTAAEGAGGNIDSGSVEATTNSTSPSAAAQTQTSTAMDQSAEKKPKEFQSLDEVRDEIRSRLARDRVSEQLTNLMSQLQSQVNSEYTAYVGRQLSAAETDGSASPAPPASLTDLAPLATQHGLKHGTTGPLSWLDLRKTPVGGSGDIETQRSLFQILFATDDLDLYQPIVTLDIDGNRYLGMKVSDTPGRIPTFEEKRDEVLQAWKRQKSAERAQKDAEKLANEAQAAGKPLADFFANNQAVQVVRTDPFSRYTGGEVARDIQGQLRQNPFRLSEPDGVVAAGPEFMDKVFSLKDGEVGAVLNHDHSIAYVVRVAEHLLSPEAMRDAYLTEAGNWPGIALMINDHARITSSLLAADLTTSRNLDWKRTPDQVQEADETATTVDE
jgi:hypothetical protein